MGIRIPPSDSCRRTRSRTCRGDGPGGLLEGAADAAAANGPGGGVVGAVAAAASAAARVSWCFQSAGHWPQVAGGGMTLFPLLLLLLLVMLLLLSVLTLLLMLLLLLYLL